MFITNTSSLVYFEGERNIDDWEQYLETELDYMGLTDYVFNKIEVPNLEADLENYGK